MTNEEKNIKICEWLGWKRVAPMAGVQWGASATKDKLWMFAHQLPNHFTDLNAMHEAQNTLTDDEWDNYSNLLGGSLKACASASASQRAEAFGKTLNLW